MERKKKLLMCIGLALVISVTIIVILVWPKSESDQNGDLKQMESTTGKMESENNGGEKTKKRNNNTEGKDSKGNEIWTGDVDAESSQKAKVEDSEGEPKGVEKTISEDNKKNNENDSDGKKRNDSEIETDLKETKITKEVNTDHHNRQENEDKTSTAAEKNADTDGTNNTIVEDEKSNPTIMVDTVVVTKNELSESVTVKIKMINNPGILGTILTVYYDQAVLTLEHANNGEAVSKILSFTPSKELKSGCNFVWDGQEIKDEDVRDGTLLELVFKINEGAKPGNYPISIVCDKNDAVDRELNAIDFSIENGSVVINE